MNRRGWVILSLLAAVWAVLLGWQVAEHLRVRKSARAGLINRAKDISNTIGYVMRSQRRFGGVTSKERLESALKELIKPGELNAIIMLNAEGAVVASAGETMGFDAKAIREGEQWGDLTVTLMNLVDLGTNITQDMERPNPTIVVPRNEMFGPGGTNMPPGPPPPSPSDLRTNTPPEMARDDAGVFRPRPAGRARARDRHDFRPWFGRPPWMNEEEYKSLIQKQGVHSFVLIMSTQPVHALWHQDLLMRAMVGVLATISVIGSGLAWRNLAKTGDLQIRLVRASELNTHLKELSLAAAGLAHETRNPLNIIRGLAQMISKQEDATPEIRTKLREIIKETDRVTAQLNEFINYSRPREVRLASVSLNAVAGEVVRALSCDIEEKNIRLQMLCESLTILADEQLLRQALFNLVLNAIQAVPSGGQVQIHARKANGAGAMLEVRDDGPGVPPEHRDRIFKPYVTMHEQGTGLGLAVVQQIVYAHGWEIQCLANEPKGANLRISHLKLAT